MSIITRGGLLVHGDRGGGRIARREQDPLSTSQDKY